MAAFLEKRRIYAVRWGIGSEHMSDAVVNDEHVSAASHLCRII